MSAGASRTDANNCFVCSSHNPIGLRIRFRLEGGVCRGAFTPQPEHVGFDGVTHGGIIYSALDDAMANWLFLQGIRGYTARCEIRYRDPLAVGTEIRLEARVVRRKGRLFMLEATASRDSDGRTVAECQARFLVADRTDAIRPAAG